MLSTDSAGAEGLLQWLSAHCRATWLSAQSRASAEDKTSKSTLWRYLQLAGPWLQVLSGGQDGAVCVWEVQQQRLLARQSIAAAHVPIRESANQTHSMSACWLDSNHQCWSLASAVQAWACLVLAEPLHPE